MTKDIKASFPCCCFVGRVHAYEGHDAHLVAFPVRVGVAAGAKTVFLTNAAGGIDPGYTPGTLAMISDQLNLTGQSPLDGPNLDALGPRFPDMTEVYDPELRAQARSLAESLGLGTLAEGVYAGNLGPAYETPAEVRMLRTLGAQMVGMSTVLEAQAARHAGARVWGCSMISNAAAGLSGKPLSHQEVTEVATEAGDKLSRLLGALMGEVVRGTSQKVSPDEPSAEPLVPGVSTGVSWAQLEQAAASAQPNAHAPYSHYQVGAAVLTDDGRVYAGCNVENASYGLTVCAERTAVGAAVTAGSLSSQASEEGGLPRKIVAVAVCTNSSPPASPCGACRQVLAEFAPPETPVRLFNPQGAKEDLTVGALLPRGFSGSDI